MHNIHVLNSPVEVEEDSCDIWLKGPHTNLSVPLSQLSVSHSTSSAFCWMTVVLSCRENHHNSTPENEQRPYESRSIN